MRNQHTTTLLVAFLGALGCGTPNPEFCCVTEAECAAAGAAELRPCGPGQACGANNSCIAADCETSADCASPEAPTCSLGLCVAGCRVDDDCTGIADRPHCDVDQVCVGCTSNEQCTDDDASICDADARACRGCVADDECASGVCIEADGVCAVEADILFVTNTGADAAPCSKAAPCKTLPFALGLVSGSRRVVRLLGGDLQLGTMPVSLSNSAIIDGSNTRLTSSAAPILMQTQGVTTLEASGDTQIRPVRDT